MIFTNGKAICESMKKQSIFKRITFGMQYDVQCDVQCATENGSIHKGYKYLLLCVIIHESQQQTR